MRIVLWSRFSIITSFSAFTPNAFFVQEPVKQSTLVRNEFGLVPPMYAGLSGNRALVSEAASVPPHPAAAAEAERGEEARHTQSMKVLRATQGLHAPLRLAMEKRVMEKMSPRLPGLYARHPLAAQLSGALDTIDFSDILNSMFALIFP
ncbi:unnamed protein product [Rodentolepis nana]|uniref:Proteasome maturation protein n=1 Tax=Rodentolepis nana TaxID=102285 RepID=A0A0R3TPY2_RODNA|nr:unnamed protein product [Rodentolepis nana]